MKKCVAGVAVAVADETDYSRSFECLERRKERQARCEWQRVKRCFAQSQYVVDVARPLALLL